MSARNPELESGRVGFLWVLGLRIWAPINSITRVPNKSIGRGSLWQGLGSLGFRISVSERFRVEGLQFN